MGICVPGVGHTRGGCYYRQIHNISQDVTNCCRNLRRVNDVVHTGTTEGFDTFVGYKVCVIYSVAYVPYFFVALHTTNTKLSRYRVGRTNA